MDRNITVYIILTAYFFLMFLLMAILLERRKKPIKAFPGIKIPVLMEIRTNALETIRQRIEEK